MQPAQNGSRSGFGNIRKDAICASGVLTGSRASEGPCFPYEKLAFRETSHFQIFTLEGLGGPGRSNPPRK